MPCAVCQRAHRCRFRLANLRLELVLCVPSTVQPTSHVQKGTTTGIAKEGVEIRPTLPGCVPSLPHLTCAIAPPAQSSNSTFPAKRTLPAERPNPRTACSAPARLSLPARDSRSTIDTAAILYSQPYLFLVAPKFSSLLSFPHFPCDCAWRTHQECSNLKYQSDGPSPPIATLKSPTPILAPAQPLPAFSPCRSNNSNRHHHRPCISANHNSTATIAVRPP